MTGQGRSTGMGSGPGNRIIAAIVLEWLAIRGRPAARDRAARALALGEAGLAAAPTWLPGEAIPAMFAAGEVDVALARALGHRLVTPDATGLRLYGLGLATPEKAYRRVQSLLPREAARAQWTVEAIEGQSARLRFDAAPGGSPDAADAPDAPHIADVADATDAADVADASDAAAVAAAPVANDAGMRRAEASLCALRRGMLEAVPGLFGLLPAEVCETSCRAEGAACCRYELRWRTESRTGLIAGVTIATGILLGTATAGVLLGGAPVWVAASMTPVGVAAFAGLLIAPAFGRVFDLTRQLEAVAGARRGHLALFDQVDDALAAKLDALARADAKLEGEDAPSPVRRSSGLGDPDPQALSGERARGILVAAQQIHATAGDLECWLDAGARASDADGEGPVDEPRGRVREIREWAASIAELGSISGSGLRASLDPGGLVRRAIATVRPLLPASAVVDVRLEPDLMSIECEPVQLEFVVIGLVRNAVEASVGLSDAPHVLVALRNASGGVELSVEDRGVGIDSSEIDEVFDPFFGERPAGSGPGLGLNVCLRIIERHGGELRIQNEGRAGTRVSVWLPEYPMEVSE